MKEVKVSQEKELKLVIRGHRLLVRPLEADRKLEIELIKITKDADQQAQAYGKVLQVGDLAWKDLSYRKVKYKYGADEWEDHVGDQWCKVGDIILYQRYSGARVPDPASGELRTDLVVINDKEVIAVVENLDEYQNAYEEAKNEALAKHREEAEMRKIGYGA